MLFFTFFLCFALTFANFTPAGSLIPLALQKKMQGMVDGNPMQIIGSLNKNSDPNEIRTVVAMLDKKLHRLEAQRDDIQRRQDEAKAAEKAEQAEKSEMASVKAEKIASAKKETSDLSGLLGLISKAAKPSGGKPNSGGSAKPSGLGGLLGLLSGLEPKATDKESAKPDKSATILALLPLLLKGLA